MNDFPCKNYQRNLLLAASLMLYAGAALSATYQGINHLSDPIFGLRLTVLLMAFGGSLIGFAYMPPVDPRSKLYVLVMCNTVMGAWFVVLIPEWRGWVVSDVAQGPLAGVISVVSVVVVPIIIRRLPAASSAILDRFLSRFFPKSLDVGDDK